MAQRKRRGFTIVELVIVIAVIAILAGVLIPTFISVINKANVSNDTALVKYLNTSLTSGSVLEAPTTMQAALDIVAEDGFDVAKIKAKASENEILWDSVNNCFVYLQGEEIVYVPDSKSVEATDVQLWKILEADEAISDKYSNYLAEGYQTKTITDLKTGIDVGKNTDISSITYKNATTTAQEVVIRTNSASTNITVNAPLDTVKHYGVAESINIVKVNTASYHEFGTVPFIQISEGRVVLEESADVNGIHVANVQTVANDGTISKTENKFSSKVTLELNGAEVKLSRDTIGIEIGDTAVLVCEVKENAASDEFIWLKATGTIEQENVYVTSTNAIPAESDKVTTATASNNAKAIANNVTNTGTTDAPNYTAVESGKTADSAEKASALKGTGTEEDPFIVYNYETMQKISDFYDLGYNYFKVDISKTNNGVIDCNPNGENWKAVNINGAFDGAGVEFVNVDKQLFRSVGKAPSNDMYIIKNITINANIVIDGYGAAAIRQAGNNLLMENVTIHGYIEGNNGAASFVCFGPGNIASSNQNSQAMNWTFKNCYSDATVVATGDSAVGFIKHPYSSASQINGQSNCLICIEDSIFEGRLSATSSNVKYFTGNGNDMLIKTTYSQSFINKYGNPEGVCYSAPTSKTNDGIFFIGNYPAEGKKIAGYEDYGTCVDTYIATGKSSVISCSSGTLPNKYETFTVNKTAGASYAKVEFEIAPNDKNESGSYLGTFASETIQLKDAGSTFNTSAIKYFDIKINAPGVTEQGINGNTFNVYDGGKFYGHTYGYAAVRVVQYDSNGNVISITTFSLSK